MKRVCLNISGYTYKTQGNKMKKIIATLVLASASFGTLAANGPAGCGLGTAVIFKNANEFHEHVLAATTNGSASQTFAMTSGTLGCEAANGPLTIGLALFLNENLEPLAVDVAQGQGESLNALASLMKIESTDQAAFNQSLKANFDQIFASENVNAEVAYQAIVDVMAQDTALVKYI